MRHRGLVASALLLGVATLTLGPTAVATNFHAGSADAQHVKLLSVQEWRAVHASTVDGHTRVPHVEQQDVMNAVQPLITMSQGSASVRDLTVDQSDSSVVVTLVGSLQDAQALADRLAATPQAAGHQLVFLTDQSPRATFTLLVGQPSASHS